MAQQISLTEEDQKIKKRWLISLIVYLVFNLIGTYSILASLDIKGESPQVFMIVALFLSIPYGLLYYFSYVRHGYHLLTIFLMQPILSFLTNASKLGVYLEIKDLSEVLVFIISTVVLNGWWYYTSIKLIMLNKRLKPSSFTIWQAGSFYTRKLNANISQECKDGIAQLQISKSKQELDGKFHALINQFPQFEPTLSKEYQAKKKSLEEESFIEGSLSN